MSMTRIDDCFARLKRAKRAALVTFVTAGDPDPETSLSILEALLEIADSSMTYRSRYLSNLHLGAVVDLLLTDESSPYQRSKHIDTRYHYIRDILQKGEIQVDYVPSEENPADIFTKALGADLHHHCVLGMGLRPFYPR
jgi:hypothetical protein